MTTGVNYEPADTSAPRKTWRIEAYIEVSNVLLYAKRD